MREFLLRGGTARSTTSTARSSGTTWLREFGRVFPDRPIVDLPLDHPVFHCFYEIDHYPQVPGLGSFLQGRTWEKGGFVSHLRAIQDDRGRAMVLINWKHRHGRRHGVVERHRISGLRPAYRRRLPDDDQRNHLFADPLSG
jgi:hypothetical protein